jgi:hypothetical protein
MAQITNLTISIGGLESRILGFPVSLGTPATPQNCRRVTLNFLMTFSPQEVGLTYRLYALLFANDNKPEDTDDGTYPFIFGEDVGLTKIAELGTNIGWSIFPKSYINLTVTNVSMPYTISDYVLEKALNEDDLVNIRPMGPGNPPLVYEHKDELLARIILSQVAEIKSIPQPL